MKNLFKYFVTFAAMAGLLVAEVVSGTFGAGITAVRTTGQSIASIQLTDTSAAANTVVVYDNDSASSTNRVFAAYTGVVQYTTNVVMSFTNFTGVAQSYTNTVLKTDNITVAAATIGLSGVKNVVFPTNNNTNTTTTATQVDLGP